EACFYLNAASFIPAITALSLIQTKGGVKTGESRILKDIIEGWRFIAEEKTILHIISMIAVFSLFGIPYITLLPALADGILNIGVEGLSLLVASTGAGSFAAAMIIAFKGDIKRKKTYLILSGFVFSVSIFSVSFSQNAFLSSFLIFFSGWGIVSFLATGNSYIQQIVPDSIRGRVMSLYVLVFLGLAPVGNSIIGIVADSAGILISLRIFSILCIMGCIIFLSYIRRRI
ncbi:MAG: MFS transporter, partial [Nitrospirae bacterium]|nr:MFS transporter [Nitrospirota bacterium]